MPTYNPDYVPTGLNNRSNDYYRTINHVRIAKNQATKTLLLGGWDGGLLVNAAFSERGADLVVNGGFADASDWTLGTGWSIANGVATCDGAQVAGTLLTNSALVEVNKSYTSLFTVVARTTGSVFSKIGNVNGGTRVAVGTYEDFTTALATSLAIQGNSIFEGDVDDYSVQESGQNWSPWNEGWVLVDDKATADGSQIAAISLTQGVAGGLVDGDDYEATFTVSDYVAGNVFVVVGTTLGTLRAADGTFVETITAGAASNFTLDGDAAFVGSVDNLRLTKVPIIPPPPGSEVTDPTITSIATNGWEAVSSDSSVFDSPYDPYTDPSYVVALRDGFNASGAPITVTDNLVIMDRVRQAYPSQASKTANNVAVQDFVFANDVVTGVTNNSTIAYHKPICMWLDHDLQRVTGQSYTAKLAVAHWAARSGRPVAAVKFTATDGTLTVSSTVSTMTRTIYSSSGLTVPHFEATLSFSTLDPDALITIDAVIYPWVGDTAFTASTDFATYPSINFCEMKVFNAVTSAEDTIFAYVDNIGGGTPAVSTTEATALANPYATVTAAAAAIVVADGTDASRGLIKITAATTITHASFSSVVVGPTPLIIEGITRATSVYQDAGAGTTNSLPASLVLRNLTLKRNAASDVIAFDTSAAAGSSNMFVLDQVTFDDGTHGISWGAYIYKVGRMWMIECDGDDVGAVRQFNSQNKMINAIGCGQSWGSTSTVIYNCAGSKALLSYFIDASISGTPASDREIVSGQFLGFSFISMTSDLRAILVNRVVGAAGIAIVGTVIEKVVTGSNAAVYINADSDSFAAENILIQHSTFFGQRTNNLYNDTAPHDLKMGQSRFTVFDEYNTKGDVAEADAAAILNWSVSHKVGWHSNCYTYGDSNIDTYGAGLWVGEYAGINDQIGTDASPVVVDWVDDQSARGGAGGNGDYSPGGSTVLKLVPAGLAAYNYDYNGTAILDDGTAYIGALQA